ncbi:nucleolar GTP-binding protein 1-domain-containing protein [Mycena vulgaris]|nr:nucleolar GTP-binding protein 1-domain-containing protein [Mycena vulgaris]
MPPSLSSTTSSHTIEMQSITTLAHFKSCVLYLVDLSKQCGYTVAAQCQLFHSIKPSDEDLMAMDLKMQACSALLAHRVDAKVKGSKITSGINRIHVVKECNKNHKNGPECRQLTREGGSGVYIYIYNVNLKENYFFANLDPDIAQKLEAL